MARQEIGISFLDLRRVGQHHRCEVSRRRRAPDRPAVPFSNQERKTPRVIDVRVRKNDRIDMRDLSRQSYVLRMCLVPAPLKEATVEQNLLSVDVDDVTRACHFACGAGERDVQ